MITLRGVYPGLGCLLGGGSDDLNSGPSASPGAGGGDYGGAQGGGGSSALSREPDIAVSVAAWNAWYQGLTGEDKAAWASAESGRTLTWPNDSNPIASIARNYYINGGGVPATPRVDPNPTVVNDVRWQADYAKWKSEEFTKKLLMFGAVAAAAGLLYMNARKGRRRK